jgi:amino acid permease
MADLRSFSGELDADQPGWREKYQAWRMGGTKGAKGEHGDQSPNAALLGNLKDHATTGDLAGILEGHDSFMFLKMARMMFGEDGQTNSEAIINLLNNCLGVGILGVAYSLKHTGLLAGLIVMVCSAFLNALTLLMHQRACEKLGISSGGTELAERVLGTSGKAFYVVLLTFFGFFCMVAMVSGTTDGMTGLLKLLLGKDAISSTFHCSGSSPCASIMISCWIVLLVPATYIRSMKNIATLSAVAFAGCLVLVTAMICTCAVKFSKDGFPKATSIHWFPPSEPSSFANLMTGLPLLLLIFSIQACGAVVLATMKDTSFANKTKVTAQSYGIVFSIDALVGSFMYLAYTDDTQKDAIKNMSLPPPFDFSGILGICALLSQLILLSLSYMLMIIPCKIALLQMLFGKSEEKQESSRAEFIGVTTVLNICALLTGLAVSDLSILFGINGAVFTVMLAFVMPTILYVKAMADPQLGKEAVKVTSPKNIPCFALCAVGVVLLVLCTQQVMKDMASAD